MRNESPVYIYMVRSSSFCYLSNKNLSLFFYFFIFRCNTSIFRHDKKNIMLTLFILTILSCSINSIWTATPYKDCGSELATIQAFEVSGCTVLPCKFMKGNTYAMNLTFQAKAPSKTASVSVHGK